MSLEFQWQMDEEEEWRSDESRKKDKKWSPWRILGLVLLLVAVGVGVAGGIFWQRVREGRKRLEGELAVVANLEAQALLSGDRETYLSLQDQDDWNRYRSREARFDGQLGDESPLEPGQRATLAVIQADWLPVENRAWAEVAWAEEDGVYRRVQFYRKTDGQWQRTGSRRAYFGEQRTHETAHFTFKYLAREEETVLWLVARFEAWYEAVCADLGCGGAQPINVLLTPDDETGGDYRPPKGFILKSPLLRGVREDGALLPEDRAQVARVLIYTLTTRRDENDVRPEAQPYLLGQFVNWELRRLGLTEPDAPSTPVLDAVMASQGMQGIQALWASMARTKSEHFALRRALGAEWSDLGVDWGEYLTALLALERQMLEWQSAEVVRSTSRPLARRIFSELMADNAGRWRARKEATFDDGLDRERSDPVYRPLAQPTVMHWERIDEVTLWAKVTYRDVAQSVRGETKLWRMEFFDLENGAWRHTAPFAGPLGDKVNVTSEHFRILCHEREVDFMVRELARLERMYRQIADALGSELLPGVRVLIEITSSAWGGIGTLPQADVYVPSPYLSFWSGEAGDSYLSSWVSAVLIERLSVGAHGADDLGGPRSMWWGIMLSAWPNLFLEPVPMDWSVLHEAEPLASVVRSGELLSLAEMEIMFENEMGYWLPEDWTERTAELAYLEAITVVAYIGETYDLQVYVTLLETMPEAESLADWLETALDVKVATFENEWKSWLKEQVTR